MSRFPTPLKPSSPLQQWYSATWEEYCALRDAPDLEHVKLAFNQGWLWVEVGSEGINHASFSDLFTMLFAFWAVQYPEQSFSSLGRCLLEHPRFRACSPDLVLYIGDDFPRWRDGKPRQIDLSTERVPDLVGEIADTTLASDLEEKKHLYEALGIPEYWVIDVKGEQVLAFQLNPQGEYQGCERSRALNGLDIALLTATLKKLPSGTNTSAAAWFAQAITL